jgi:hypothetical protein
MENGNICSDGIITRQPSGNTIAPSPFVVGILAVYLLGFVAQWLTAPMVLGRLGPWPFLIVQAVLIGAWYLLHARRLRDVGRNLAPAQGIAAIAVLAIVLLVLVGVFYMENVSAAGWTPESFLLVRHLMNFSRGAGDLLTLLGLVACVVLMIPPVFSVWAARQPGLRA